MPEKIFMSGFYGIKLEPGGLPRGNARAKYCFHKTLARRATLVPASAGLREGRRVRLPVGQSDVFEKRYELNFRNHGQDHRAAVSFLVEELTDLVADIVADIGPIDRTLNRRS